MLRLSRRLAALGLLIGLGSGCAGPPKESKTLVETLEPADDDLAQDLTDRRAGSRIAPPEGSPAPASKSNVDERAMVDVITELQALGALDPAAQQKLMEDLKRTDPALWPQLTQVYRSAALSVQQRLREAAQTTSRAQPHGRQSIIAATARIPPAGAPPATTSVPSTQPAGQAMVATAENIPQAASPFSFSIAVPDGSSDVAQVAYRSVPGAAWRPALEQTIRSLESQTRQPPRSTDEISQHAVLRLLYLAAGRQNDALQPIVGIPPGEQDFWSHQLYGMSVWLDSDREPDIDQRAADAAAYLDKARARLAEIGALRVRNLAFCTEVSSYGVIKEFQSNEFEPGQEVILYAEVENFKSEPTPEGFHTALQSSYQILDGRGQRVAENEFATTEEYCRNPRRDFFLRYHIYIPERVHDGGRYTLQLRIEDTLSRKVGQSSIELTIKS